MGSAGDAYDNALCERFLAALECGLLDRLQFRKPSEAMRAVFEVPDHDAGTATLTGPARASRCHPIPNS